MRDGAGGGAVMGLAPADEAVVGGDLHHYCVALHGLADTERDARGRGHGKRRGVGFDVRDLHDPNPLSLPGRGHTAPPPRPLPPWGGGVLQVLYFGLDRHLTWPGFFKTWGLSPAQAFPYT